MSKINRLACIILNLFLVQGYAASAFVKPCASCHGLTGVSTHSNIPHLAGQHAPYLLRQLQAFRGGLRQQHPPLENLSDAELTSIATYYATQPHIAHTHTTHAFPRGEIIYRQGDGTRHILACITCHGPDGLGSPYAQFPLLAGQHATYTMNQLKAFRDKTRQTDLNGIMQTVSASMNNDDIRAVADYIAGLPTQMKEKR